MTTTALVRRIAGDVEEVLSDSDRYKCRFKVRSQSSNQLYLVSFDSAAGAGYWTCSCRGNIAHGSCKHLEAMGLNGRKYVKGLSWGGEVKRLTGD